MASGLLALALFGVDEIGVEILDPLGGDPDDLPLDAIGRGIEAALPRSCGDEPASLCEFGAVTFAPRTTVHRRARATATRVISRGIDLACGVLVLPTWRK